MIISTILARYLGYKNNYSSAMRNTIRNIILVPTYACTAKCRYCFSSNVGDVMHSSILGNAIEWIYDTTDSNQNIDFCFHGGEPLSVGFDWYNKAIKILKNKFDNRVKISIQSNLWLLDDAYCELFCKYNVSIGVSLDGPKHINDLQRGDGYYDRTIKGIQLAKKHGLNVGVISTFTKQSAIFWKEIFDFFIEQNLSFSIHGAIPAYGKKNFPESITMPSDNYVNLMISMFDYYMLNTQNIRVDTFDQMARSLNGNRSVCIFNNCLGHHLAIAPNGDIYPCNRFSIDSSWRLGNVNDNPSLEDLTRSPGWIILKNRENTIKDECCDCAYYTNCYGGCPYQALAFGRDKRDGYCEAYKKLFSHITDYALNQMFTDDNEAQKNNHSSNKNDLSHNKPLIQIMRGDMHPSHTASKARKIAASVALAVANSPSLALLALDKVGLVTQPDHALMVLEDLWDHLHEKHHHWREAYIHITTLCNLFCSHCYSNSNEKKNAESMRLEQIIEIIRILNKNKFQSIKITGGEPMMYLHWANLLSAIENLRQDGELCRMVLRTNLSLPLTSNDIELVKDCFDDIIVSVDGDEKSHDMRRGAGSYVQTIENLRMMAKCNKNGKISIAATLSNEMWSGFEGQNVRSLGSELGVDVRIRPVLPLGRLGNCSLLPSFDESILMMDSCSVINKFKSIRSSCSLGQNIHIEVNGDCYPCFALINEKYKIGNIFFDNTDEVLRKNIAYIRHTVDTNHKCQSCEWRYLCGGHCRLWRSNDDLNSAPINCDASKKQSKYILKSALEFLEIDEMKWRDAGLPI